MKLMQKMRLHVLALHVGQQVNFFSSGKHMVHFKYNVSIFLICLNIFPLHNLLQAWQKNSKYFPVQTPVFAKS